MCISPTNWLLFIKINLHEESLFNKNFKVITQNFLNK